jgi:hypothetical protein
MNTEGMLDELLQLLEKAGVEVRMEQMGGGGGGVCSVKGKSIVFLDVQASAMERAAVCARALAKAVNLEEVYMKPEVRQFVEREDQRSI